MGRTLKVQAPLTQSAEKKEVILLKTLLSSYALITFKEQKEFKGEKWYRHAERISKYFKKRKPTYTTKEDSAWLDLKYEEVKQLDMDYFEDKLFSPYFPMIIILDYLINELDDFEMRLHFFIDINPRKVLEELETTEKLREVGFDTYKYMKLITDLLET